MVDKWQTEYNRELRKHMSEGLRENYRKTMSRHGLKQDFYGESKEVQRFLDVFGLEPNRFDALTDNAAPCKLPDVSVIDDSQFDNQFGLQ